MTSKYVPRVNQLDAIQLDSEIGRIIDEQLNFCYSTLPVNTNWLLLIEQLI